MKIVSILHPSDTRLPALAGAGGDEHQIVVPRGVTGPCTMALAQGRPVRPGRSRLSYYAGLRPVLAGADIIHLRSDPATVLAYQVIRLSRSVAPQAAVIIEADHRAGQEAALLWRLLARRVLARADAAVVRHADGLAALRLLGFDGAGMIGGAVPWHWPARAGRSGPLTLGLAARFAGNASGAIDLLEAVAALSAIHLVAVASPGHQRLSDRAAALEMQDRIRFVPADELLASCDILAAVPHPRAGYRLPFDGLIATAQASGIPVICSNVAGLAEMTGAGGWVVPPGDAGAVFEVLRKLQEGAGNPETGWPACSRP